LKTSANGRAFREADFEGADLETVIAGLLPDRLRQNTGGEFCEIDFIG